MPGMQRRASPQGSAENRDRTPCAAIEPAAVALGDQRRFAALANEVRQSLEETRRALETEVRLYPTPIPRCDAQFNHLYELRSRVTGLLARVEGAIETGDAGALAQVFEQFTRLPGPAPDPARRRVLERVEAVLASARGSTG